MVSEYRPCVVAVFTNKDSQILVCERSDFRGAWQLPQGGIEPGESALNAVYREMKEELGCDRFKIIKEASGLIKYKFPESLGEANGLPSRSNIVQKWIGQSQIWFLTNFDDGHAPDLANGDGEFVAMDWRTVSEVVSGIVHWKKDAYMEGLTKLGLM